MRNNLVTPIQQIINRVKNAMSFKKQLCSWFFLLLVTPFGLLAQAPTITNFAPSSGSVGTLITITGTNLANPTALTINGVSAIAISNNGTTLVAMVMPGAATGAVSVSTAGGTANSTGNFTMIASQTPSVQQGNKLVGSGATGNAQQSSAVAVSADGNTAIVGGSLDNSFVGAAWIFTRSGGVWSQQGNKLVGTGAVGNAQQGTSVAISADGNTVIVGGYVDDSFKGAAWVYSRSGGVWAQQGNKLVGTGAVGNGVQGVSVSLSADGNTAIVGGNGDNSDVGAAWVYTRSGGTWSQQGSKLVGTGAIGAATQGSSVSISADGNTVIVGGNNDNTLIGAIWVYTRSGGVWTQQGNKLVGTGQVGSSRQGCSVSISADGNTAIVGGYSDNINTGAAWVYSRSGGVWAQQGNKLVGTGAVGNSRQGVSVSISADGNTAIIGGYFDDGNKGAAWTYSRNGGVWAQQGNKLVGTGAVGNSKQGVSVSISADGNTSIVGGLQDNSDVGAAWVFVAPLPPTITNFTATSGPVGTLVTITGTNLNSPTALTIGGVAAIPISNDGTTLVAMVMPGATTGAVSVTTAGGTANGTGNFTVTVSQGVPNTQQGNKLVGTGAVGNANQGVAIAVSADGSTAIVGANADNGAIGAAWMYTRSGGVWSQQGTKLVGTGAVGFSFQGNSVAISADGNTAIVGGQNDNSGAGAVWVYIRTGGVWSQQGSKLVGTGSVGNANQGQSVSLSADGNTAIVGGHNDNSNAGAAWVYTRTGGVWTQQGNKLVGTGNIGAAGQGWSVALSADGNTALVGGNRDNSNVGAIWVYTRSGGVWSQQGNKLVGTGGVGTQWQGQSVSLSADGNTALIGGNRDNANRGAAWIFTRSAGVWAQQGNKLVGSGAVGTIVYQGQSVTISADGNTAIIGGYNDNSGVGATWIYTRNAGVWTQQGNKLLGSGAQGASTQGSSVSISADATAVLIGGNSDNSGMGAAWVYTYIPAPTITNFTATSGPVGTLVTITGTNLSSPTAITIGGVASIPISNDGSTLVAMVMPGATTGAVSITTAGGTANGTGNYTVTTVLPPNAQQGNKLVGSGSIGNANQGTAVAVSADGNTAIVGAPDDNSNVGAAWIYTRSGGVWSQQGNKLVGTGTVGIGLQGCSVAISADGTTAVVGGFADNSSRGAAWVFRRSSGIWSQEGAKLVGTGATGNAQQGKSVSISADGNTIVSGGAVDNGTVGAIWVFTRTAGVWSQQGTKLVGSGNVGTSGQGNSIALSADGNTVIVGAQSDNSNVGAAWIFVRTAGVWAQQGTKLVGTGAVGAAAQGTSVAISADGNTTLVGCLYDDNNKGAVWVFTRTGGVWNQQGAKLVGTGAIGNAVQGKSVALSADGNTAVVGGNADNGSIGAAWVYTRSGGVWNQQGNKLTSTGGVSPQTLGSGAALSADGTTLLLGGLNDDGGIGAAWAYTYAPPPAISSATYNANTGILTVTATNLLATAGASNDIAVNKLSLRGEASGVYTLTTTNVEISNATSFTVTLNATDKAAVNLLLNKNGTSSNGGTAYNIAAANDWMVALPGNADLVGNAVTVSDVATISTTGALSALTSTYGTASTATSFNVSGSALTNNIAVTAPAGFEVSTTAGTGFGSSITLTQAGGTVGATTIYVRLKAANTVAASPYMGNITCTSTNAITVNVATVSSTVTGAPLTITANNANKLYGATLTGTAGSTAFTSTGLLNGETIGSVTIAYGTGAAATASVATYTGSVTPSAATGGTFAASNYTITYATGNIIVGAAPLTITASNANKVYGSTLTGAAGSTAFASTGLLNGETIGSVTIAYGTGAAATAAVGTYTGSVTPSVATGGTFTASNYNIAYATGNIIVGAAPLTITASNVNKVYGSTLIGAAGSTAFASTGLLNGETIGSVTIAYGTGAAATAVVGTYTGSVTPSAATGGTFTASNYTITYTNGTLTVNPASLTIAANNANKQYGATLTGAAGSTAFTSTGLLNGETIGSVTIAYGIGAATTAAVGTYTGSVTPIAATGGTFTASNYTTTYATGNIIVGAAPLTITASNANKVYGSILTGATGLTVFTSTGLLNGETIGSVTIAYGAGAAATAAVGTYTGSVTPSAATGGTFIAGNYNITYSSGNIIIAAKSLTITGVAISNKIYDGNTSATFSSTGILNGVVSGDNVAIGGTIAALFNNANVGSNKVVSVTGYSLIGSSANNYAFSPPTDLTATITFKPLTISGISANSKVFDGNTTASISGTPILTGVVGTDNVSISGTPIATFANSAVANNISVTVTGYTLSGSAAGNYTLEQPTGLSANITPLVSINNPSLSVTGSLNTFSSCINTVSPIQNFQVAGIYLNGVVTLTAPTGYELSINQNGTYSNSIGLTPVTGTLVSTTVYVRLNSNTVGSLSGNIIATSSNATNQNIAVNGTANALPIVTASASPASVVKGLTTQLTATATGSIAGYAWSPTTNIANVNQASTQARVIQSTTYTVTATSLQGCVGTANVSVTAIDDLYIAPVTVFSPNQDGINDRFVIKNIDQYPNNKLQVFDRSGKVVYEKIGYDNTWNGMVGGKQLVKDTYFYILSINGQIVKKGTITLVR